MRESSESLVVNDRYSARKRRNLSPELHPRSGNEHKQIGCTQELPECQNFRFSNWFFFPGIPNLQILRVGFSFQGSSTACTQCYFSKMQMLYWSIRCKVWNLVQRVRRVAIEKSVDQGAEPSPDLEVWTDSYQIFSNLIGQNLKFWHSGIIPGCIHCTKFSTITLGRSSLWGPPFFFKKTLPVQYSVNYSNLTICNASNGALLS